MRKVSAILGIGMMAVGIIFVVFGTAQVNAAVPQTPGSQYGVVVMDCNQSCSVIVYSGNNYVGEIQSMQSDGLIFIYIGAIIAVSGALCFATAFPSSSPRGAALMPTQA